jgi:hypothetical protein
LANQQLRDIIRGGQCDSEADADVSRYATIAVAAASEIQDSSQQQTHGRGAVAPQHFVTINGQRLLLKLEAARAVL